MKLHGVTSDPPAMCGRQPLALVLILILIPVPIPVPSECLGLSLLSLA